MKTESINNGSIKHCHGVCIDCVEDSGARKQGMFWLWAPTFLDEVKQAVSDGVNRASS